jgi:hypothetical protein
MGRLSEEIQGILREAREGHAEPPLPPDDDLDEWGDEVEAEAPCLGDSTDAPCWHLQEAAQFLAEDVAEVTGVDPEVLSAALVEAMSCDTGCREKYVTAKGDFKGGKGEAFKSCVDYAKQCCTGIKDPKAFCAYIGRRAGKI